MTTVIYGISDAHLGASLRKDNEKLYTYPIKALKDATTKILKDFTQFSKGIVIFSGDNSDKDSLTRETITVYEESCRKFTEVGLEIWSIAGNHDKSNPLAGFKNVQEFTESEYPDFPVIIRGINYCDQETLHKELKRINDEGGCEWLIMHVAFKHLLPWEGAYQISIEDMEQYPLIKNIFVGDIHTKDISSLSNGGKIVSSGNISPTKVDEDTKKSILKVVNKDISFIELESLNIYRHTIKKEKEIELLKTLLKKIPLKEHAFVYITYDIEYREQIKQVYTKYKRENLYFDFAPVYRHLEEESIDFKGKDIPTLGDVVDQSTRISEQLKSTLKFSLDHCATKDIKKHLDDIKLIKEK